VVLFPHLAGLDLDQVEDLGGMVRITARTRTAALACRDCGVVSSQVHDRYRRGLADLGCGGRPVQVVLEVRRFCCGNPACEVATFAEQVPGLTGWYQRRTASLRALLENLLAMSSWRGTPVIDPAAFAKLDAMRRRTPAAQIDPDVPNSPY